MGANRRARPTIRCLIEDLGTELPDLSVDLGELDDPWVAELRRVAPTSPRGQKRILSIDHPLVYRLRVSSERGATWLDESGTLWLCAVRRREEGSEEDAFQWFAQLHHQDRLLPSDDDQLRDRAEEVLRSFRKGHQDLLSLVARARQEPAREQTEELDGFLPARALAYQSEGMEEIWCAISMRSSEGAFVGAELRDLLFASLEEDLAPAAFEARNDWPTGEVGWFEAVRLALR